MATMSMNTVIHGAVRRDLQRFLHATARFPAGDTARAAALGTAWDNFDAQLTVHHEGEHEIAWPALEQVGVPGALLDSMDAEHDEMADSLATARGAMHRLRATANATDADEAHHALAALQRVTLAHFEHEESELEPVYLANADSPVIKEMGRKFGKVSLPMAGRFFAWLTDGATPEEKAAITESVPKPVLTIIGGIFGRGYRRSVAPVWRS